MVEEMEVKVKDMRRRYKNVTIDFETLVRLMFNIELIDGEKRFLVKRINGVLLEHFLQEHLTQDSGQLINQSADAQVLIVDDGLLVLKDLAHINGSLGLLISIGKL